MQADTQSTNRVLRIRQKYRQFGFSILPIVSGDGFADAGSGTVNKQGWLAATSMGEIVNLRNFRKQAKKLQDTERAAANRHIHGRSKSERDLETIRTARLKKHLDLHKIESGDA